MLRVREILAFGSKLPAWRRKTNKGSTSWQEQVKPWLWTEKSRNRQVSWHRLNYQGQTGVRGQPAKGLRSEGRPSAVKPGELCDGLSAAGQGQRCEPRGVFR